MSKEFGHTKTLFLQNGKYYKWSYKHNYCVNCKTCKFKHKGRGLCTSCFDKERKLKSNKRKFNLKKQNWKHYYKTRILMFLEKKEDLRFGKRESDFDFKTYQKKWYKENYERISLQRKVERRLKNNLPCLQININGKTRFLPFEDLEKPKSVGNADGLTPEYFEWREKVKQFEILTAFYRKQKQK